MKRSSLLALALAISLLGVFPLARVNAKVNLKAESFSSWCTQNGGVSKKTTCTVNDAVVGLGKILLVPPGRTLIIHRTLTNDGTIGSSGTIVNNGSIVNNGALGNNGVVDSCGPGASIYNSNSGAIENNGVIYSDVGIAGDGAYSGNVTEVCP